MAPGFTIEKGDVGRDREEVVAFLLRSFSGDVPDFRQRYDAYYAGSPLGEADFWVARLPDGRIVGLIAVHRAAARVDGERVTTGVQADFCVDPEHRGPFGPAVPLVRTMNAWLDESGLAFSYGIPGAMSHALITSLSGETIAPVTVLFRRTRLDLLAARRGAPTPVRLALRLLDPLHRLRFRDGRGRRSRRLAVEHPTAFDERFGPLWREAAERQRVIGERSVELLDRKLGMGAGRRGERPRLVAVLDDGAVAGYAVTVEVDGVVHVLDLVCRPEPAAADAVIREALRHGRSAAGVRFAFVGGDPVLRERLRSFGFVPQATPSVLTVRFAPGTDDPGLREASSWYVVRWDDDFAWSDPF